MRTSWTTTKKAGVPFQHLSPPPIPPPPHSGLLASTASQKLQQRAAINTQVRMAPMRSKTTTTCFYCVLGVHLVTKIKGDDTNETPRGKTQPIDRNRWFFCSWLLVLLRRGAAAAASCLIYPVFAAGVLSVRTK